MRRGIVKPAQSYEACYQGFHWPVPESFNIADAGITVGAVFLIIDALFFSGRQDA